VGLFSLFLSLDGSSYTGDLKTKSMDVGRAANLQQLFILRSATFKEGDCSDARAINSLST